MEINPIRREAGQSVEDLTEQLAAAPLNRMYQKEDLSVSQQKISEIVLSMLDALTVAFPDTQEESVFRAGRVALDNVPGLRDTAIRYLSACANAGRVPTFAAYCSALGYSRKRVYEIMQTRKNRGTEFLDFFQGVCAAALEQAGLHRATDTAVTIFALKNGGQGYADRVDITATAGRAEPYESGDPEEIARRYLAGMARNYEDR